MAGGFSSRPGTECLVRTQCLAVSSISVARGQFGTFPGIRPAVIGPGLWNAGLPTTCVGTWGFADGGGAACVASRFPHPGAKNRMAAAAATVNPIWVWRQLIFILEVAASGLVK